MSPEATAACIALGGVLVSSIISYVIAHRKLSTENRLSLAAYTAIRRLLKQTDWQMRSFEAIKSHLPGFTDDELKKLLVAAGAVSFTSDHGKELWGLLDRNHERLKPTGTTEGEGNPDEGTKRSGGGGGPALAKVLFQR